jgi:hypothetical protein
MSKQSNSNKLAFFLGAAAISLSSLFAHTALAEEALEDYSETDRHKAIVMCMTVEYVQFHQEYPAEQDVMDLCNQRFQQLTQDIPYAEYKNWVLDTPYSPYPAPETSAILEQYNRIMLGLDSQFPMIN